jgi:tetratricopeptide (TPR) repeat protein
VTSESSDTNPLGLSLGFIEGMALVSLRDRAIADGVQIKALDLELLDVRFPLDVKTGVEELRPRPTRLRTLVLDVQLDALARHLQAGLLRAGTPIKRVSLRAESGAVLVEAEMALEDRRAFIAGTLAVAPSEPRELRFVFQDLLELGYFPVTAHLLAEHVRQAVIELLGRSGEHVLDSLRRSGASSFALDPVDVLMQALMPQSGWKMPRHEDQPLQRAEVTPDGRIRVELGDLSAQRPTEQASKASGPDPAIMRALAKDDAASIAADAMKLLEKGDAPGAFMRMKDKLDASGGPDVLIERLLSIGSSDPQLFPEASDLADDVLKKKPDAIVALAAKARIASYEGDKHRAFELLERIAKLLRDSARKRASGLAFLAASRHATPRTSDRARVLEEAIVAFPDDLEALGGLVEELPPLGRAAAAVRAARRLAHLAETNDAKVRAHVAAGDLLRDALKDPVQAKREYERALKIAPEDESALEGLARAVMDQGDPRRAATIFERLIARAEQAGQTERAARLSVVLGDLWRPLDPEAAMVRYRRAKELSPSDVAALARLAGAASEAGRIEAAVEAVENALPLLSRDDVEHDKKSVLALRLRAGSILEKDPSRIQEATAQYEAALQIEPESADALIALDVLYERSGRSERRAAIIGRHAEVSSRSGDLESAARLWGEKARLVSKDQAALRDIREAVSTALAKDRRHRALLDVLVDVSELGRDPAPIIEAIDRRLVLDDPPEVRAKLLVRLGAALEGASRVSEAARAYEEALALDSGQRRAVEALTTIYRQKDDQERLAHALERAANLAKKGERATILAERARLLAASGLDADAFAAASLSLDDAPDSVELLALATQLALRLEKFKEASDLAKRRLRLHAIAEQSGDKGIQAIDPLLAIQLDRVRAAEGTGDDGELIAALIESHALADPLSETGRQVAAKLSRALSAAARFKELAALLRSRAELKETPALERAERYLDAARLEAKLGQERAAEGDARNALELIESNGQHGDLEKAALDLVESMVRKHGDARQLAAVLRKRAKAALAPREKEMLRLEQAHVLESAELAVLAIEALEEASDELPSSIEVARALGQAAEKANRPEVAAAAYGRAAKLAENARQHEVAIEMHGRAALAGALLGDAGYAVSHDRALLALCPPGATSQYAVRAIERLERHAREEKDDLLLIEVLSRKAAASPPSIAARFLLEKAKIEAEGKNDRAALDSLKRARAIAPEASDVAEQIDEVLVTMLERLEMFAEQAAVLVERAERSSRMERQSKLYLDAALVYAERLGDRAMALSRAQAAIRASANNEAARVLRIKLLREGGRRDLLVDALADEASMSVDAESAARQWVEAAEILLPEARAAAEGAAERPNRIDLERGLDLVRRASAASPRSADPLRFAALYARLLGRADEELLSLGQLVERDVPEEERIAAHIRRVDLLKSGLEDPVGAQVELTGVLALVEGLAAERRPRVLEHLPASTETALKLADQPLLEGVIRAAIDLSDENRDHATQVRMFLKWVDLVDDLERRADLRTRAGEVFEWKLGDGASAEREYLAALALSPRHEKARAALKNFYVSVDRFGDLAENLGVDALREVLRKIRSVEPPARVMAAAEALWPMLEDGEAERAEVMLELADLYTAGVSSSNAEQAVHVLEQVIKAAPREHQNRALERLAVLFLEQERFDLYVDVLRRQAERIENDKQRAQALADLGEALEWKIGDGGAAEQEYRAALAIDPECAPAKKRLAVLLSSQDRFEELGRDLGAQTLAEELDLLIHKGDRDRVRAWNAAEALARDLDVERRGTMWFRLAERIAGEPEERAALDRASQEPGPFQETALDRLIALLEETGDRTAVADALRRRVALEESAVERLELHLRLGTLLQTMIASARSTVRESLETESEKELRAVLEIDRDHIAARLILETIYVDSDRLVDAGRVLGKETLQAIRQRAESDGDTGLLERSIEALAELSTGEERAEYMVQLIDFAADNAQKEAAKANQTVRIPVDAVERDRLRADRWTMERLYQEALDSCPTYVPAREGLRALYEAEGRYREIAQVLGADALRDTLEQLRQLDDRAGLLPAALALSQALEKANGDVRSRASLHLEIASLHLADDDADAAEHALREALKLQPENSVAREEIRQLLVAQDRLVELAEIDEALLIATGTAAAEANDARLEVRVMRVLADRRDGERKADTLVIVASLFGRLSDRRSAESALREALKAHPPNKMARAELEAVLWEDERFSELVSALGPEAIIARAERSLDDEPLRALVALDTVEDALPAELRARALELSARIEIQGREDEFKRRLGELARARALWDQIGDASGQERARLAIADIHRSRGDAERLLEALADASRYTGSSNAAAAVAVERAELLSRWRRIDEARALVEQLIDDPSAPEELRLRAAAMLVDRLLETDLAALSLDDLELRARSLVLLTSAKDVELRWLLDLAGTREALGLEGEEIAVPLEGALSRTADREQELSIRRRLREIYEQLGDWKRAEAHAAIIAEADNSPELWVALSELRVWLDDREGARVALMRALRVDPAFHAAHSGLLRLAEHTGEKETIIERLEAWAEADRQGTRRERAERMLRAAKIGAEAGRGDRAAALAERAVDLIGRQDPESEPIALDACAILEPLGRKEAIAAILGRVVGQAAPSPRASELRLYLADTLIGLERPEEAATVIEQGVHRHTPEDDPLVERLLADSKALGHEAASRRLLHLADRLGAGPTARRLRLEGAERAEHANQVDIARGAWTAIASEVGGDESVKARRSLLRLARSLNEPSNLVTALIDAADDAPTTIERASLLGEAANRADRDLGDPMRAEALLRRALTADPDNEQLKDRLLELLEAHGRHATLDEELAARATKLRGQQLASTLSRQAQNARDYLHDDRRAAELFLRAYDAEAALFRGTAAVELLIDTEDYAKAAVLAARVLDEGRGDASATRALWMLRAEALERSGEVDQAVVALTEAQKSGARSDLVEYRLIDLLAHRSRWRELASLLDASAAQVDPGEGMRRRIAAARILLERLDDKAGAQALLVSAMKLAPAWLADPDAPLLDPLLADKKAGWVEGSALGELAHLAEAVGAHPLRVDALRLRAQSLPVGPAQWRALVALASAECEAGDVDAAEFTLRGAVEAIRGSPDVQQEDRIEAERALGRLLLDRNNANDAVDALSRAVELVRKSEPRSEISEAKLLVELASAEHAAGSYARALSTLTQARALDQSAVLERDLEQAIEAAGPSERLAELRHKKAAESTDPEERARLYREAARLYVSLGEPRKAVEPRLLAYKAVPTTKQEAQEIGELLYHAERWPDLERHLERRLEVEDLTDQERLGLVVARGRILAQHLGRGVEALEELGEARDLMPGSTEVLEAIADVAALLELDDIRQDALSRLTTVASSPRIKQSALSERAMILERSGEVAGAAQSLEDAIDIALENGSVPRLLVDRLARIYAARGHWASCARLWVKVAEHMSGAEAAAALSRAAHIRVDELGDRRGAMAALEAAARLVESDLGIRRALVELARNLGDVDKARAHAHAGAAAALRAGAADAHFAFTLDEASLAVEGGDRASAAAIIAASGRSNGHDPRFSFSDKTAETPEQEEVYRVSRSMLDRSGRWFELAELEERHAQLMEDPLKKSAALVQVGRLYAETRTAEETPTQVEGSSVDRISRARDAFLRALHLNPENVEALSRLAKLELESAEWTRASPVFDRLEQLGGPGWPVPRFELRGAGVAGCVQESRLEHARLLRARERDPSSIEALAGLAELMGLEGGARRAHLDDYEQALDPIVSAKELARVWEIRAEQALAEGKPRDALASVERAIELDARRISARRLRRRVLESAEAAAGDQSVPTRYLVDALVEESRETSLMDAVKLLLRALDLADAAGDAKRAHDIGVTIEQIAHDDEEVFLRLKKFFTAQRDGASLLKVVDRLGGIEELGEISEETKIELARSYAAVDRAREACILLASFQDEGHERFADAIARALGPKDQGKTSFAMPAVLAAVKALAAQEPRDPAFVRFLEGVHALVPKDRAIAEHLARAYRSQESRIADSAEVYRRLLAEDPFHAPLLSSLKEVLKEAPDPWEREGVDAVLTLLGVVDARSDAVVAMSPSAVRPSEPALKAHLRLPSVRSDLGELLRLTSHVLAGVLPPAAAALTDRADASEDPRIADVVEGLRPLSAHPFAVLVDVEGGYRVSIEPGDPPAVVIGEALVEDATPAELRFHIARSMMLLELGHLLFERTHAANRRHMLELLLAAADPESNTRVSPEAATMIDRIREKLGPGGLAEAEPLASRLKGSSIELGGWMYGAVSTANRFGLLAAGDLEAAVRALRRNDPHTLGERFDAQAGRATALRRSHAASELVAFALSGGYVALAREGRVSDADGSRF